MRDFQISTAGRWLRGFTAFSTAALLFLPLFPALLNGQSGSAGRYGPQTTCQVQGTLVDASTGALVPGIGLHALAAGSSGIPAARAVSDMSGDFLFSSLMPGEYKIEAEGQRYPSQVYGHFLNLTADHCSEHILFKLEPPGVITGHVMNAEGRPMSKVRVLATTGLEPAGLGGYVRVGSSQTNSQGDFRIPGLYEGQYYVAAIPQANPSATAGDESYVAEVYPGTRDPNAFTSITIRLGDAVGGVDFMLTAVNTARMSGQVISALTNQPVSHSRVTLESTDFVLRLIGMYSQPILTNAKGQFAIGAVPPGSYLLTSFASVNRVSLYGELNVRPLSGQDLQDLRLIDTKLPEIVGNVSVNSGPHANINSLKIRLSAVASDPVFRVQLAAVHADGTFVLPAIFPGLYRLTVENLSPDFYLKAATLNGSGVLHNGLTLSSATPEAMLEISLGSDGGMLTGTVHQEDNAPAAGAVVALIPDSPQENRIDLFKRTITNAMGAFTLSDIAPGDYHILACQGTDGQDCSGPDFVAKVERLGTSVEVQARNLQFLELETVSTGTSP